MQHKELNKTINHLKQRNIYDLACSCQRNSQFEDKGAAEWLSDALLHNDSEEEQIAAYLTLYDYLNALSKVRGEYRYTFLGNSNLYVILNEENKLIIVDLLKSIRFDILKNVPKLFKKYPLNLLIIIKIFSLSHLQEVLNSKFFVEYLVEYIDILWLLDLRKQLRLDVQEADKLLAIFCRPELPNTFNLKDPQDRTWMYRLLAHMAMSAYNKINPEYDNDPIEKTYSSYKEALDFIKIMHNIIPTKNWISNDFSSVISIETLLSTSKEERKKYLCANILSLIKLNFTKLAIGFYFSELKSQVSDEELIGTVTLRPILS